MIFITIEKEDVKHPLYLIENKSKSVILKYKQKDGMYWEYCDTDESNRFAWDNLFDKHILQCEPWHKGDTNNRIGTYNIKLDFMEQEEEIAYSTEEDLHKFDEDEEGYETIHYGKEISLLYYYTYTNGYTKILVFDDRKRVDKEREVEDHTPELMCNLELGGVGVSLVLDGNENYIDERRELCFCNFKNIQAIMIDFKTERRMQFQVGRLQIDNQYAIDTPFPITLYNDTIAKDSKDKKKSKKEEKKGDKNEEEKETKPFFNLNVILVKDIPEVLYFKKIEFLIQKMIFQADDELVLNFLYFGEVMMKTLDTTFTGICEIFVEPSNNGEKVTQNSLSSIAVNQRIISSDEQEFTHKLLVKIPNWRNDEIVRSKRHLYIKYYSSSPLHMNISFYTSMKIESDHFFNSFLKRFGLALNTIEGAPIKVNALELEDVVGTNEDILYILKDRYISRLRKNIFAILGASSLIGNPIQLVNNVGNGVKDFFYKPIEGFVEGPLEGGKGILKGSGSLFKHTVKGTFGSASSIFGSLSKGALMLANDKEYMKERETNKIKERPDNAIQGIGYGLKSAAKSFGSGIAGVVKMPVQGAKQKGFLGFFKGVGKGVTGLVAKPISGTLDLVSKTTEGIKNTTTTNEDRLRGKIDRMRLPRVFYTNQRIVKPFNELHAFAVNYIDQK